MLRFNMVLRDVGIDPADVRLLRHQPQAGGRSILDVWRADRPLFEAYQALQPVEGRTRFGRRYWASFIGAWDGRTVFVGLYETQGRKELQEAGTDLLTGRAYDANTVDRYTTMLAARLGNYRGRLFVDWGGGASGKRAWNQRADIQDKLVTELHRDVAEEPFPGLLEVNMPLTQLATSPPSWIEQLSAARGVYLLICPRDGSQYVGSAIGHGGFWARWSEYRANGHGGNVALMARERSDYHATILQVAGSADTNDDILASEARWKGKLQSGVWGLTRN